MLAAFSRNNGVTFRTRTVGSKGNLAVARCTVGARHSTLRCAPPPAMARYSSCRLASQGSIGNYLRLGARIPVMLVSTCIHAWM